MTAHLPDPIPPVPPVRVLVLDDHEVVTEGVRALLDREDGLEVVETAGSLDAALSTDVSPDPDVIVADLVLGADRAADVVTALAARFRRAAILVLSMADDLTVIRSALAAGASGYLAKQAGGSDLVSAVRRVARGEHYLQDAVGVALARGGAPKPVPAPMLPLSEREMEVGRLLALGHTNAEIGDLLIVSVRTVETHRARLYGKLGVRTRAELVRTAAQIGLVNPFSA